MASTLEDILAQTFDYAGTFPPAALPFEEAIKKAALFPHSLKRPALVAADFVTSWENLAKLTPESLTSFGFGSGRLVKVATIGTALAVGNPTFINELKELRRFNHEGQAGKLKFQATSYEVKLTSDVQGDKARLKKILQEFGRHLSEGNIQGFVEPILSGTGWHNELRRIAEILGDIPQQGIATPVGLKVRGSGDTAIRNEQLCYVIVSSIERKLPLKATAGLHHPIIERTKYGNTLGFLNLKVALYLASILPTDIFPPEAIFECLNNADPKSFIFENGLAWRKFSISQDELEWAIEQTQFAIGSCSLDEPDQDLLRLYGPPAA